MRVSTHHFDLYIPVRGDTHRGIQYFFYYGHEPRLRDDKFFHGITFYKCRYLLKVPLSRVNRRGIIVNKPQGTDNRKKLQAI